MKEIDKKIVISNDLDLILNGNNAFNYSYLARNIQIPSKDFIDNLRKGFYKLSKNIYNTDIAIVSEEEMSESLDILTRDLIGKYPIISMDQIYIKPDNQKIYSLDVTRLTGSKELISRLNPLDKDGVKKQVIRISNELKDKGAKEIILLDDVIFSGSVIESISKLFNDNDIKVIGAVASISSNEAYNNFSGLPYGVRCGFLMSDKVVDEICERDFFYGIAQSGMAKLVDGKVYKAPYFLPFGDPVARASVPKDKAIEFSKGLIRLSLNLWEKIEKLSKREIINKELPERILNTNENESINKTLKKVL